MNQSNKALMQTSRGKLEVHQDLWNYVYDQNTPCCLLHGLGHWTKDCTILTKQEVDKKGKKL